jgi:hypothetical protein
MLWVTILNDDGTPNPEKTAEFNRLVATPTSPQLCPKRRYWSDVLWKGERSNYWAEALIGEGVERLSDVSWTVILRMERSRKYKQLGKKGADRLAKFAGLGPRPKWEPGRYTISSDPPA